MTPDTQPKLTRETAFHPRTSQLTRSFSEYRGYWLPTCFSSHGPITEYWACRERVAIMDLSPLRKFEVIGPDAEVLLQTTFTRDVSKLGVGQVVYGAMCYDHGGMIDDGTLFRLSQTNFRWVCGEEFTGNWLREQAEQHDLKVWVKSSSDFLHNCAVQGPKSREVLSKLIWTPPAQPKLTELKWFRFTIGRLGDEKGIPLLVSRTGYTGELGYEIWCHPKDAIVVWDAVIEAGQPFDLIPLGLAALDMLRIEAGLAFSGYEFCDQTDPFEAGIGFCVSNKAADYVGKQALIERKAHPQRKLVGLIFGSNEAIYHDDPVYVGRAQIGAVTSATYSPKLERWIALSHINTSHANIGEPVEIGKLDGRQKRIAATVVCFPHYDPDKSRVRV
jgi:aminomethyltransferase